ncbi:hypothetical protein ABE485_21325 [Achromobacter spanius]|uniref:hypothetical protein n=1 Tax=Achromobacter spanius TaxID=217203 RepID=UPI003207CE3F
MMTLRIALRLLLVGAAGASIAACADSPPRQADMDYRTRPSAVSPDAGRDSNAPGQRLTIQSGEGERLNLPWFIQGTQDWINSN